MKLINTRVIAHPVNWLTVWSMVFIMGYVGHLLVCFFSGRHPGAVPSSGSTAGVAGPGTDVPENTFS